MKGQLEFPENLGKGTATNSNSLIPISLKSVDVNLRYFKLRPFDQQNSQFEITKVYDIGLHRYRDYAF